MPQLEIIHLRASSEPASALGPRILKSLASDDRRGNLLVIYRRNGLDTDLALHLHHRDDARGSIPSVLGLRLAAALRSFGMVEHGVWEALG
jgi:hypothetical protein